MSSLQSTGDARNDVLQKSDLSEPDKDNFSCIFNLIVLEILTDIGWDSPKFNKHAKECLSQACAKILHSALKFLYWQ
jgi:hypothetical protein